ncbi:MAG: metallophosphoesterase [Chloroflexota bacterium]|nr:metallophosphoesterase [Dehalococcoidia bacterium]MDW8252426.1 metallophosphoesterase [Chloroflexota bacterium]
MPSARDARSLRVLHTSDLHLGNDYAPDLAAHALRAVVAAARRARADALLLVGDVFDHNRVSDATVQLLLDELAQFPGPAVILPGNHDCYDAHSVYRRPHFLRRPANVHLIARDENPALVLEALNVELWGRPVIDHHPGFRPLRAAPPRVQARWRIVLAHGHVEPASAQSFRSSPIWPEEIAATDCDYLALGHWDRMADVSHGGVVAHYSGAPYTGAGLTAALLVRLTPRHGVTVDRLALNGAA